MDILKELSQPNGTSRVIGQIVEVVEKEKDLNERIAMLSTIATALINFVAILKNIKEKQQGALTPEMASLFPAEERGGLIGAAASGLETLLNPGEALKRVRTGSPEGFFAGGGGPDITTLEEKKEEEGGIVSKAWEGFKDLIGLDAEDESQYVSGVVYELDDGRTVTKLPSGQWVEVTETDDDEEIEYDETEVEFI
jgi:hypothetical protein